MCGHKNVYKPVYVVNKFFFISCSFYAGMSLKINKWSILFTSYDVLVTVRWRRKQGNVSQQREKSTSIKKHKP